MVTFWSASSRRKAKMWVSLSFLPRVAASFLKSDKNRIGNSYKKTIYKEYKDDSYMEEMVQPAWLGFLGPVLRAEVGDVILIHLKNFATRPYTIHPHGVFYEKDSEGKISHPFFLLLATNITFYLLSYEREREAGNEDSLLFWTEVAVTLPRENMGTIISSAIHTLCNFGQVTARL